MDARILRLLDADMDSLSTKVVTLVGPEDEDSAALISGLLLAARRLLASLEASPPPRPRPDGRGEKEGRELPRPSRTRRPRRDLRREMAGPLPAVAGSRDPGRNGSRAAPRHLSKDGLSGGEPDDYDVIQGRPDKLCPECGGEYASHPIDTHLPLRGGLTPVVLCNRDRCYTTVAPLHQ